MSIDLGNELNSAVADLASTLLDIASSEKTRSEMESEFSDALVDKLKTLVQEIVAEVEAES
jgi:hypothetical protein